MRLYHYTCKHCAPRIAADGYLIPNALHAPPLIWLTSMRDPNRDALGLTSYLLDCDRMKFRFTVDTDDAMTWAEWRLGHPEYLAWATELELAEGARPGLWWVAEQPLPWVAETRLRP